MGNSYGSGARVKSSATPSSTPPATTTTPSATEIADFAVPEFCGELSVAEPAAWLLGRRLWRTYFCTIEDGLKPVLRCYSSNSGRISHAYALAGSSVAEERPKLTRLGHAKGRPVIRIALGGRAWLFLSAPNTLQHAQWLRNLKILTPNKNRNYLDNSTDNIPPHNTDDESSDTKLARKKSQRARLSSSALSVVFSMLAYTNKKRDKPRSTVATTTTATTTTTCPRYEAGAAVAEGISPAAGRSATTTSSFLSSDQRRDDESSFKILDDGAIDKFMHTCISHVQADLNSVITAYAQFANAQRADMKTSCPDASAPEIEQLLEAAWKSIDGKPEQKGYIDLATNDRFLLSHGAAEALFRSYRWDWLALRDAWYWDENRVRKSIGLPPRKHQPDGEMIPKESNKGSRETSGESKVSSAAAATTGKCSSSAFSSEGDDKDDGSTALFECPICCETFIALELSAKTHALPECGHRFCNACWSDALRYNVSAGALHLWTAGASCLQHGCRHYLSSHDYQMHLDALCSSTSSEAKQGTVFGTAATVAPEATAPDMIKYKNYSRNDFVDMCPLLQFCPSPHGCRLAAAVPVGSSSLICGTDQINDNSFALRCAAVVCHCGHCYCFGCRQAPHEGASCEHAARWRALEKTLQEEELDKRKKKSRKKISANPMESDNWLAKHTRPCPECKIPIQRNYGCNHMTCNRCGHEFCWVCMEPWATHGTKTGGFYRCDINDEKKTRLRLRELRADQLKKGLVNRQQIYRSFVSHQIQMRERAVETASRVHDYVVRAARHESSSPVAVLHNNPLGRYHAEVTRGSSVLCKLRRLLKWAYVAHWSLPETGSTRKESEKDRPADTRLGAQSSLHSSILFTAITAVHMLADYCQQILAAPLEALSRGVIKREQCEMEDTSTRHPMDLHTQRAKKIVSRCIVARDQLFRILMLLYDTGCMDKGAFGKLKSKTARKKGNIKEDTIFAAAVSTTIDRIVSSQEGTAGENKVARVTAAASKDDESLGTLHDEEDTTDVGEYAGGRGRRRPPRQPLPDDDNDVCSVGATRPYRSLLAGLPLEAFRLCAGCHKVAPRSWFLSSEWARGRGKSMCAACQGKDEDGEQGEDYYACVLCSNKPHSGSWNHLGHPAFHYASANSWECSCEVCGTTCYPPDVVVVMCELMARVRSSWKHGDLGKGENSAQGVEEGEESRDEPAEAKLSDAIALDESLTATVSSRRNWHCQVCSPLVKNEPFRSKCKICLTRRNGRHLRRDQFRYSSGLRQNSRLDSLEDVQDYVGSFTRQRREHNLLDRQRGNLTPANRLLLERPFSCHRCTYDNDGGSICVMCFTPRQEVIVTTAVAGGLAGDPAGGKADEVVDEGNGHGGHQSGDQSGDDDDTDRESAPRGSIRDLFEMQLYEDQERAMSDSRAIVSGPWACTVCTFINEELGSDWCSMCGSPFRPPQVSIGRM